MNWSQVVIDRLETVASLPAALTNLQPPRSIAEFLEVADRPQADVGALATLVAKSPDLTAGVLRLANPCGIFSKLKVQHVGDAVQRLGVQRCRMAVTTAALQATLKGLQSGSFEGAILHAEAQRRAIFARLTAKALGVDADYAYVAGMLQDLLLPFLRLKYPGEYAEIATSGESIVAGERERFGWDHGLVTAQLLKSWNFPEEVIVCVACHHDVETLLAGCNTPLSILTASLAAAMLPDTFQQEPQGVQHLLRIQGSLPEFDFLQVAVETDDAFDVDDGARVSLDPLCESLQQLAIECIDTQRKEFDWSGSHIGRYLVEDKIGKGAMGVVYRARHSMLRRPAAIKFMSSQNFDSTAVTRFEREAQATSRLQSPHTVHVYDYGTTENGMLYYVMEYLDGLTLRKLVETFGLQPAGRVIHILSQVCGSLGEAHSKGLIHRDIKPENIGLCESSGVRDFVKVMDFGLVYSLHGGHPEVDGNRLVGTPHYMSPESILRPGFIDHRADLYALGAVGYYLLTGQHVFPLPSTSHVLQAHLETKPERPSQRLGQPVGSDLEEVILCCLQKNADRRPSTARQLAEMLLSCERAGEWTPEVARNWWKSHGSQLTHAMPSEHHDSQAETREVPRVPAADTKEMANATLTWTESLFVKQPAKRG